MSKLSVDNFKKEDIDHAINTSTRVLNSSGHEVGKLVQAGCWLLDELAIIDQIVGWRRKFSKMFPTRSIVSVESTVRYLNEIFFADEDAIFFLVLTNENKLIGHVGLTGLHGAEFELVNLVRGESGGHKDLIPFAEVCAIDIGFRLSDATKCVVELMSYNWLVSSLHESIGFTKARSYPLRKIADRNGVRHSKVQESHKNVEYTIDLLSLSKEVFSKNQRASAL